MSEKIEDGLVERVARAILNAIASKDEYGWEFRATVYFQSSGDLCIPRIATEAARAAIAEMKKDPIPVLRFPEGE